MGTYWLTYKVQERTVLCACVAGGKERSFRQAVETSLYTLPSQLHAWDFEKATSLSLSFVICKLRMLIPTSKGLL